MENVFGERISRLLKERGMTQSALAKKMGIGDASLSKYIKGVYKPKASVAESAARALGVRPAYLLGFEERELANDISTIKSLIRDNAPYMDLSDKVEIVTLLFDDNTSFTSF